MRCYANTDNPTPILARRDNPLTCTGIRRCLTKT
jgi:hypothetical protein